MRLALVGSVCAAALVVTALVVAMHLFDAGKAALVCLDPGALGHDRSVVSEMRAGGWAEGGDCIYRDADGHVVDTVSARPGPRVLAHPADSLERSAVAIAVTWVLAVCAIWGLWILGRPRRAVAPSGRAQVPV